MVKRYVIFVAEAFNDEFSYCLRLWRNRGSRLLR